MRFAIHGQPKKGSLDRFAEGTRRTLIERGHREVENPDRAALVLNLFPADEPRSFRRKARSVFLAGVTRTERVADEPLETGYPLLVRSLSNLQVVLEGRDPLPEVHFFTPERGHYVVEPPGAAGDGGDRAVEEYFAGVYERIEPLASSTLVIANEFVPDLPVELRAGDEVTRSITRAGERLDELDLLPTPFPLDEILAPDERRHLKRLFGIGGLSYGNVSARRDDGSFWMSASGVDKSRLREVGREIQLVTGYDPETNAIRVSVPDDVEPRRVSVDAIEHWMIYREHPEVGAILHVHAWMEDVPVTDFNYPCGTYELAAAVAEEVRRAEDPARAVVGLKNHGLTITGRTLDGIFDRIEGRIRRQIPMG